MEGGVFTHLVCSPPFIAPGCGSVCRSLQSFSLTSIVLCLEIAV
jgi:hypothetical protein